METARRPREWTTFAALGLTIVLTLAFAAHGVVQLLTLSDPQTTREAMLGVARENDGTGRTITAVLTLAFCALTASIAIGIWCRRPGSRHAGIALFLLLGIVSLASSLAGWAADPPAPNAWMGTLNGVACLAISALLLQQRTADNFDRAEADRRWRANQKPHKTFTYREKRPHRSG